MTDTHNKEDVLEQVLLVLEREVEWPLTDHINFEEVARLLAPLRERVNSELIE